MSERLSDKWRETLGIGDDADAADAPRPASFGRKTDAAPFPTRDGLQVVDLDAFDERTANERSARARASARMLFGTDVSKLDEAGASALYQSVTEGLFGISDEDGTVAFGKRASKDPRANIDMLRRFVRGEYSLIEDPEYTKWKAMDEEAKFRYALENETVLGSKLGSYMKGERGAGFWENLRGGAGMSIPGLPAGAVAFQPKAIREQNAELAKESARRSNYDTLTDEEKAQYRADVIGDYDEKLSRRQTLATFLKFANGLSDRAGYLLAKSFNDGTVDPNVETLVGPDGDTTERDRVYAAFSLMRGDQKKGRILGIETDFTDGTALNRVQLGLYGFQQSVVGLVTDTAEFGKNLAITAYAKTAMDESERAEFYKGWNAIVRAEQAMKQNLPEADTFVGEAFQALSENLHWFIPYEAIGKGGKMMKAAWGLEKDAGWWKTLGMTLRPIKLGVKAKKEEAATLKLGRAAAEAEAAAVKAAWTLNIDGAEKLGEYGSALLARQLAAVERYSEMITGIEKEIKAAAWWKDAVGAGMWAAGEASAFGAFASEYIANADAAGISREESVLTAAAIGLLNSWVERLYVPGMESSLSPAQIKSLSLAAMAEAVQKEGAAGFRQWLANRVSKGVTEGVKVTLTEGAIEEPLQQIVVEHGKAFDRMCQKLRESGEATFANEAMAAFRSLAITPEDWATFIDTAVDMVPSSIGFGVTTVGNASRRQYIHNVLTRHANRRAGSQSTMLTARNAQEMLESTDYDVGIVDVMQRAIDVRKMLDAHWGGAEANPNRTVEALTAARKAWRDSQGSGVEAIAKATGLDVKTAEVLSQYFSVEADMELVSPRFSAWKDLNLSLADIDENTIRTLLPGYVEGSFASDPERGIYAAKTKLGDGVERTIAYRRGDISDILLSQVAENEKIDSEFGASWDASIDEHNAAGVVDGAIQADMRRKWREMSEAERHDAAVQAALATKGIEHREGGVFELSDSKGNKVVVNANDVISLSNGRVGDIGYGAAATQATVRHETFHALWRFVRGTLGDAEVQQLAKSVGVDVTKKGWEVDLDEKMANQLERYASGHYVAHAISSKLDRFLDSGAGKLVDFFGKIGQGDEVTNPNTGKSYQLKDFYDEVLRGRLGSGALGVALKATKTQGQAPASGQDGDGVRGEAPSVSKSAMPVEVTDEERAAHEEETRGASAAEEAPVPPETPNSSTPNSPTPSSAEEPADASTPNQRFYRVGLPNSDVKLVGRLEVRDAETGVNTSTDAEYHDRGNQNRDDTSEESRALVEKIGANPDPLQVGTVQPMANNGIVWALPNGDVIIGNHRVNGVRLGYEKGTAGALEKFVREDAARRGIEIGEGVKKPLMVFVLERIESPDGKADEHEVVRLANESQNRGFNVREQAQNDAKILLDNNLLPQMAFRADGRIDETKSGDAIGKFRQESGAQGMVAEDGSLTEEGQTRIMNASLAALLGRGGNAALLQKIMANAGRLDMQSELRALMKATPELMSIAESKPGYDLREPLAEALTLFTEWRDKDEEMRLEKGKSRHDWRERAKDGHRLRGIPWQVHMSQGDMFRTPSPEALILGDMLAEAEELRSFDREDVESAAGKKRVIDLITNYLSDYAAAARAVNTETDDMFGTPPATRAEVLSAQRAKGGADGGARFSVSMRETLDPAAWGDLSRKVKVVGDGTSTWKYKEGWTTKQAKAELLDLAEKNLKLQGNYTTDTKSGNHALRIGNVLYRITAKGLFHGADRRLKRIGVVIARIGDVLNASVEVPNVELPWHYRIASVNFETPEYVLLTSRSVGGAEDIVDVQSLYAVNAKADATAQTVTSTGIGLAGTSGAARELNHTNTSRLTEDILSNLRDAWQGAFFENLVRHNIDSMLKDKSAPLARQHEAVVEKYRGTPQWMKAPNGQPTKLTEQQWIQVRTPSFKAWFGDWEEDAKNASKVVDENGEPLVVYRGAPFDPLAQKPGDGVIKPEAYFTADPEYAKRYTGNGGKVRAYYLNIRSPFDIRRPECLADLQKVYPDHNFERGRSGALDWAEASTVDGELLRDSFGDKYDGVIYDEGGDPGASGVSYRGISYVPIKGGKRVKSATDNNGDFSENPDVRFSVDQSRLKPATQEEFDRAIASWGEMKVDGSNAELAKWLFPDGRVLQPKLVPVMGGRAMSASHDSLFEFLDRPERTDPVERFEYGYADALAGGAIRLDLGNAGIEVARRPTDGQLDALYDILDAGYAVMEGEDYDNFAVDVDSETGGNAFTAVYRRGTSARKIVDDLREYFDSGSVPAAAGARYSVAPVYTGTAADYANRSRQGGVDDGPSLLKIGTGEGSQVYGWGLYGSTVRGVAERYAKDAREYNAEKNGKRIDLIFPENMLEAETAKRLMENGGDVRKTIEKLKLKGIGSAIIKELEEHGAEYSVAPKNEHLYEQTFFTDRAPGDESHLLKWYDAISDANWDRVIAQAEKEGLREKLKGAWWLHFNGDLEHFITDNGNSGDAIYERLSKLLGGPQSASEFLVRAGIDGVKYPVDSYGGKTVKDGDVAGWNYVSFRDDNIRVDHKWTDGKMRYSIAGEKWAEKWKDRTKSLSAAKDMEAMGFDRAAIWRETDWWRGEDGKWRVEVADRQLMSSLLSVLFAADSFKLGEVVSGKVKGVKLPSEAKRTLAGYLSAYPKMADLALGMSYIRSANTAAQFIPSQNRIELGKGHGFSDDKMAANLAHEIQHAIQEYEGFAKGGSVSEFRKRAWDDKKLKKAFSEYRRLSNWRDERMVLDEAARSLQTNIAGRSDSDLVVRQRHALSGIAADLGMEDEVQLLRAWGAQHNQSSASGQYYRLAGEREARLVEERLAMSGDERRAEPPWKTLERMDARHGMAGAKPIVRFSVSITRPWAKDFPHATLMTTRSALMASHADLFNRAKAGDAEAAADLIDALMSDEKRRAKVLQLKKDHPNAAIACPVHAEEVSGRNALPFAYAQYIADALGMDVDDTIVQTVKAGHTGSDAWHRLTHRAQFEGDVEDGKEYILVDDHITQGGTINELRSYIENNGGKVVAVAALTASKGSAILSPSKEIIDELKARYPDIDQLLRDADIAGSVDAITNSEAEYIKSFSPDTFRDRIAQAKQERAAREAEEPLGAPSPDGSRHSVEPPRRQMAYPQLRQMSDDELVSAAVAVRMALGASDKFSDKAVKVNTVQGIMRRLHPDWDTTTVGRESQRVISDAKKFGRQIRDDLDRGVSESRVLAHLPDKMREAFGTEMREEARRGQRLGTFGAKVSGEIEERQARVIEDAVRVQTGLDASVVESTFGVDLSETLMHLADNPLKDGAPASGQSASADAAGDDAQGGEQKVVDVPAAVAKAVSEVVERSRRYADENAEKRKARKAEQGQGEAGDSTDGQAGLGHEEGVDPVAVATRKAGLDLENPRHLAEFVAELTRRYWIKDHGLAQTADVWRDLVAVQFLRKTAQSVYAKLCRELTYSRSRETAMQRIAKFDAAPTVAGLLSEMEFVGALINAQRIRDTKKGMCEKLDLFLREQFGAQGRFKPDREEGARKVSAEAELRARYMRHAMWLTPDAAALEAGELQRTIDELSVDFKDAGRDRDQSREFVDAIRKLNVLREFGALRYRSLGEIESAARWWEDFARGSSDDIVREMSDREIRTKKAAHLLAVAFADPKRANVREGAGDWLNRFITGHMGFVSLLQDCMRGASAADAAAVKDIVDYIAREIQKTGDRSEAEKRRHNDAFHAAVESIYGRGFNAVMKEMMAPDERFAKYMGVVGGKRVTPTKGRALQLLVSLLQEGRRVEVEDEENPGKTKFVWEGGYHDNIVKHHREGQAQELMKLLTPQDMNMLKWLGAWYEQNRSGLSDVCRSLFGIGVYAELPNYFPVKMQLETQGLEKGQGVSWTIFPKALTPRVKNERDFDTSADIFSMWESRMEEAAQWKHHARLGLEMRGIFGRSELREAVRANHGAAVDDLMQGFITDILAGQGAVDRTTGGVQYFSDQIRGWTALCGLGGNVGVMLKQTTSIPAFGFEIGLVNTAKYMVSAFTPEGMEAMRRIWDSEQRRTRWQVGSSEAVRNALSQKNAGVLKRLLQASMITNKVGDSVPALVIGQGIYRDCLARGMSEEDAMAETWSIVERTQQSGRMENQTSVQRRNKLGRIMFQFLSTQQQYLQYEVRAIREVIARPDSVQRWGNLGRAILLNHFILSSAYFWMGELYKACLGQEPPEDELKDWVISCLLGPYGSLFVAGFCCKYTLERAIKGYSIKGGSSMLPMEAWLKTQVNDGAKLLEAIFDSDGDTWENMLEAAGRWMSDSNSTVRDLRKLYRYRVKGERQRR